MGDVLSMQQHKAARATRQPMPPATPSCQPVDGAVSQPQLVLFPGLRIDLIRTVLQSWQIARST